jgi:catechol 2,3-dioxygenase
MDAPNLSAQPTFCSRAPLHIGTVALTVRDLGAVTAYYRHLLGLSEIARTGDTVRLGIDGVAFLELTHRPAAQPDDEREAGLYHTAFLMPTRTDLARWVRHIVQMQVPITGASDHGVSEAIYLDDPEGNGVEVYADRPAESWEWRDGLVSMITERLDIPGLVQADNGVPYTEAPPGLRVGHIHLRVGDVATAERFFHELIGLDITRGGRHGATFMSTGRYHHHVAANIWDSRGAGPRDVERAGLDWFEIEANDSSALDRIADRLRHAGAPVQAGERGFETADPWGTRVRLVPAAG